mmetsp:Transcript_33302/g.83470  ORF Transcript_33302/g.83470 Transcript_33302/m.83470 type:complete len:232 (+) Transcript_33302:194-889(+)
MEGHEVVERVAVARVAQIDNGAGREARWQVRALLRRAVPPQEHIERGDVAMQPARPPRGRNHAVASRHHAARALPCLRVRPGDRGSYQGAAIGRNVLSQLLRQRLGEQARLGEGAPHVLPARGEEGAEGPPECVQGRFLRTHFRAAARHAILHVQPECAVRKRQAVQRRELAAQEGRDGGPLRLPQLWPEHRDGRAQLARGDKIRQHALLPHAMLVVPRDGHFAVAPALGQ